MSDARAVPLIVAHRGGAPDEPENSWPAFLHAIEQGYDFIEFDVNLSADGVPVIFHNARVHGVPITRLTLSELLALLPELLTLDDLLDRIEGTGNPTFMVIDIKGRNTDRAVAPVIERRGLVPHVLVTSKHAGSLRRLKRRIPPLRTGLSHGASLGHSRLLPAPFLRVMIWVVRLFVLTVGLARMRWAGVCVAALHYLVIDEATVQTLRAAGIRTDAWTVDDPGVANQLLRYGVDMLTTNRPLVVLDGWSTSS